MLCFCLRECIDATSSVSTETHHKDYYNAAGKATDRSIRQKKIYLFSTRLSFSIVECKSKADVIRTEPTGAGDDLCWHQVFVIVWLALYALEPTVELLICFNAQRNKSLTLITASATTE